jgi:nitrate/nitrite transporter NarK
VILISGIGLCLSYILLALAIPHSLVWLGVLLAGWFNYFPSGPLFAVPAGLPELDSHSLGTFIGIMMVLSGIGGFISPIIVATLQNTTGTFTLGFLLSAFVAALLVLPGLLGRETGSHKD